MGSTNLCSLSELAQTNNRPVDWQNVSHAHPDLLDSLKELQYGYRIRRNLRGGIHPSQADEITAKGGCICRRGCSDGRHSAPIRNT